MKQEFLVVKVSVLKSKNTLKYNIFYIYSHLYVMFDHTISMCNPCRLLLPESSWSVHSKNTCNRQQQIHVLYTVCTVRISVYSQLSVCMCMHVCMCACVYLEIHELVLGK